MAKGATFDNDFLNLILNAVAIANIADNAATAPLTNLYFGLHTADPGTGGSQTTSEVAYTSYARTAILRNNTKWTVTANSAVSVGTVSFPQGTGGTGTATNWSLGTAVSGTGKILYTGTISPSIVCGNGVTPQLGSVTITET